MSCGVAAVETRSASQQLWRLSVGPREGRWPLLGEAIARADSFGGVGGGVAVFGEPLVAG